MANTRGAVFSKILILVGVSTAFAALLLWLIEPPINYAFVGLEIAAAIAIYLVTDESRSVFKLDFESPKAQRVLDFTIVIVPSLLIICAMFNIDIELVRAPVALLTTSLIPGYTILRLSRLYRRFSKLETFLFSYLLSYVYTGFVWFALSPLSLNLRPTILVASIMVLGILSVVAKDPVKRERPPSLCQSTDVLALAVVIGFFTISFLFIYPGFALLRGTDISRHYGWSLALGRNPALYNGFAYLLAHLHESAFLYVSNVSVALAQMALLALNLMIPLAFYVAAKAFLSRVDPRMPALATLFWALFSNSFGGFAWVYFTLLKIGDPTQSQAQLLTNTADHTYNGTIYGILGLWYVPATIGFVILLSLLSLVGNRSVSRKAFIPLFSILFASLLLTHMPEAVFLSLFLAALSLVWRNETLEIGGGLVSIALGYTLVLIVYAISAIVFVRFGLSASMLFSLAVPMGAIASVLVLRRLKLTPRDLLSNRVGFDAAKTVATALFLGVVFVYIVACLSSSFLLEGFHTRQVDSIGLVPWFLYPIMLGVNGLLGLVAIHWVVRDRRFLNVLFFLTLLLGVAFVAGRLVSLANLSLFQVGYWEKRFIWIEKIPLAMLAPLPVLVVATRLRAKLTRYHTRVFVAASLIGAVVLSGLATTALNVNYWANVSATPEYSPSLLEADAITSLRRLIDRDPAAWLATVTDISSGYAVFAGPPDKLEFKQVLYQSQWPDMALLQLYRHPALSHAYIYIANRDSVTLSGQPGSALARYIEGLPVAYKNSEVTIYDSPKPSFPEYDGKVVLVTPFDNFLTLQQLYSAYYALAGSRISYTTGYDLDNTILNHETLVLAFDPPRSLQSVQELQTGFDEELREWEIISGSWVVDGSSLIAGSSTTATEGLILTPLSLNSFNVSFSVSPEQLSPGVANYVAVAYSYVDGRHFELAEILFHPNGLIYALTRTVDGTTWEQSPTNPAWPGNSSGISWEMNSTYRIEILRGSSEIQVFLNGTRVLVGTANNSAGRVGLCYKRANLVRIDDFVLSGQRSLITRLMNDYIEFLDDGGTVIVLNTNGYNSFADEMLVLGNSTISSDLIIGPYLEITLPNRIPVQIVAPNGSSTEIVANYSSDASLASVYLARKQIGQGNLFYVNLYPILEAFRQGILSSPSLSTISQLLDMLQLPRMSEHALSADGYAKAVSITDGTVTADSALFPVGMLVDSVEIVSGGNRYSFDNVTLLLVDSSCVLVNVNESYLEGGRGLYSKLTIHTPFSLEFPDSNAIVSVNSSAGSAVLTSVANMTVSVRDRLNLIVRYPRIDASAAIFHGLVSLGYLNSKTGAYGQDLLIDGRVVFTVGMSDTYSLLQNVDFAGLWTLSPPLMDYDPLSTVPVAVFWSFILALMVFVMFLAIRVAALIKRARSRRQRLPDYGYSWP